jgi:hypothetical protein
VQADDKKKVIPREISDFFIRYGGGAHYVQRFTKIKAWNFIAWTLIVLGTCGWVLFLMWKP